MSTAALVPIAGAAAGAVAAGASKAVASGLSFLAELASGGEPALDAVAAAEPTQPTGEQIDGMNSKLREFAAKLKQRLQAMGIGIDPTQQLEIEQQPWGSIAADPNHPQRDGVEAALASDPLLASEFHQLADEYRDMAEAQGIAVGPASQFQLTISGDNVSAGFSR